VVGRAVDEATIADLHTALDDDLDPFDDMNSSGAYKLHIAKELAGRAVRKLTENEGAMA
jgi:CO/xanthine dehydrogenase FAD-binding subunit